MAGNVWAWTRSLYDKAYPYNPADGREDLKAGDNCPRVLRGGSFHFYQYFARCASRYGDGPDGFFDDCGFRVVSLSASGL
jgi:formylglycine-generating enzyme required for sulfatase activity